MFHLISYYQTVGPSEALIKRYSVTICGTTDQETDHTKKTGDKPCFYSFSGNEVKVVKGKLKHTWLRCGAGSSELGHTGMTPGTWNWTANLPQTYRKEEKREKKKSR